MKHYQDNKGMYLVRYHYLMTIFLHSKTSLVVTGREAAALQDVTQRVGNQFNVVIICSFRATLNIEHQRSQFRSNHHVIGINYKHHQV